MQLGKPEVRIVAAVFDCPHELAPVIDQQGIALGGASDKFGLGDTLQSLFLSPKEAEPFIWGVGPALLLPTATDSLLGGEKWAAGPTAVILKQSGAWTYGALAKAHDSGARAVGGACAHNPYPIVIPCHRVTSSGGARENYSAGDGPVTKAWLIAHEARHSGRTLL